MVITLFVLRGSVTYTTEEPYKECYTRFISKFQITLASFRNFKISLVILK
jgi:hypothetical protein